MEGVGSPSSFEGVSIEVDISEENVEEIDESNVEEQPLMHVVSEEATISHLHLDAAEDSSEKLAIEFKTETMGAFELDHFVTSRDVESDVTEQAMDGSGQLTTILKTEGNETVNIVSAPLEMTVSEDIETPQQYIILTRPAEESSEALKAQGLPSKYIRFDGADGQTYVLAVTDELTDELVAVKTNPTQQVVPPKNRKINRKHQSNESSVPQGSSASGSSSSRSKTGHNASVDWINQAWFTTRGDKNALQKSGLEWKQGQWTKEEVEVLETNISNYCKEHDIKDPAEVIFEMSKDERKDFYRTIALGIQRPLFSVYRRVTRMYDRKNHRGKYTAAEIKHLRMLRAKHGNDWAAIGVALGRSASSVKDKCRLMKDNCKSGKWYPEEEERLAEAVYKLTGLKPSDSITSGLSWASVAEHVGTRSEKQCRTKWLNYLNWKQQGGADWTRDDDQLLIEKVSAMDVTNDSEIDWEALSQDWKSVRSPQWLRGKWWALKRHIVDYNKLSYSALLEQMKQVIYWNLKPKAGTRQSKIDIGAAHSSQATTVTAQGSHTDIFKNCIPVSLTSVDNNGTLALSYCAPEEESFQAFEVLPHWRPQVLGAMSQAGSPGQTTHGIINGDGHIIVQTISPELAESIQLSGQQQVIISSAAGVGTEEAGSTAVEGMTIQVTEGLVQADQDLTSLSTGTVIHESGIDAAFETGGEEIVTGSEFHEQPVTSDQDIMSHDVFETVTSDASNDLGMGVSSPPHARRIMTSLKDPILMSSSDVECDKSQAAELTDENTELD